MRNSKGHILLSKFNTKICCHSFNGIIELLLHLWIKQKPNGYKVSKCLSCVTKELKEHDLILVFTDLFMIKKNIFLNMATTTNDKYFILSFYIQEK